MPIRKIEVERRAGEHPGRHPPALNYGVGNSAAERRPELAPQQLGKPSH